MDDMLKHINDPDILVKRIIAEIQNDNIDNALYLTDTFVFIFSYDNDPQTELISAFTELSNKLVKDGQLDQAETLISKALLISPDNSMLLSSFVEIKKKQRAEIRKLGRLSVKDFAYKFIKKHFPEELSLFDTAWRVFKNIQPKDLVSMPIPEALGLSGPDGSDLNSPQVIIILNIFSRKGEQVSSEKELTKILTDIGNEVGCAPELLNEIIQSVSKEYL
jgi:hypothetical protein